MDNSPTSEFQGILRVIRTAVQFLVEFTLDLTLLIDAASVAPFYVERSFYVEGGRSAEQSARAEAHHQENEASPTPGRCRGRPLATEQRGSLHRDAHAAEATRRDAAEFTCKPLSTQALSTCKPYYAGTARAASCHFQLLAPS